MTPRQGMELGLRLLGCWGGLLVLMSLIDAVGMLVGLPSLPGGGMPRSYWVWTIAGDVLQGLLCGGLIVAAPRLARKWSPHDEPHDEPRGDRPTIGPGDLYHLGCYLLGMYALFQAVAPITESLVNLFDNDPFTPGKPLAFTLGTSLIYLTGGLILIFGAERLAGLVRNLAYDPDTVPKQRFSIALLLIAMILFAILLTLVRKLS